MDHPNGRQIRVAILDLYNGHPNEGMRCIRQILNEFGAAHHLQLLFDEYDVRGTARVPDLSYDLFISTGGPGSPFDGIGMDWEENYFSWLEAVLQWNQHPGHHRKKHVFFICHSFQMACRYFQVATVCKRRSTAFGVFPVHPIEGAEDEPVFRGLQNPFYAVDSRDYQVVQPSFEQLRKIGARILCIEKDRPHVPLERALMAIRFNDYMVGTQFHPEADAMGMSMYLQKEDKKKTVIENHGFDKWKGMIEHLEDPDKILWTYNHILPNFLAQSIYSQVPEPVS
ncbi:MAG TPA: homoserine O-succinyltransferase [Lacibacter sp.]|nr:homoserine O-succinyltransferase [Lacibacter sp.]HMO90038.1 homoserine O-succinyltransferase [Lacibacter sp.]HMP88152.1 homoserine O-succinyltransferase [Lacibacter sp.]